jgi:hypothetical protein
VAPKGIELRKSRFAGGSVRTAVLTAVAALVALCAFAPTLASGAYGSETQAEGSSTPTVYIKDGRKGLRFVAPKTIVAGEELRVLNQTDPRKVGPHTFSLVTRGSLPKTPKQRQLCFTPHHICKAIAAWHGVKGNGPPKENPAEAGPPGWSTLGSLSKKGDSWFTGEKPGTSYEQPVTADTAAGPTRIYFVCAIHPWMQGSINVLPGG